MPDLAFNGIISHIIDYRVDAQTCLLTQHYRITAPSTGGVDMDALFTAMDTEFKTGFGHDELLAACLSEDVTIPRRYLQAIYPIRYIRFDYVMEDDVGTVASPNLPPAVASAITCVPEIAQKGRVGTKHMGGVPTSFVTAGEISSTGVSAYNAFASFIGNTFTVTVSGTDVTLTPILYNRTTPVNSLAIFTTRIQSTSRTERRRVVGRGV